MTGAILVLNAGSSSLKFALYDAETLHPACRGSIEQIGDSARFSIKGPHTERFARAAPMPTAGSHETIVAWLLEAIRASAPELPVVLAGHRVVHGGTRFDKSVRVDAEVLAQIEALAELAPGHQPHNIAGIRTAGKVWPGLPQVACFDTAFHRTQPRLAQLYGLPHALTDAGYLRYGFHGLSYDYIASALPAVAGASAGARVIVAHLGNGASLCALKERRSIATTMGFTALDGLMMGTRAGALDPGVLLHLIEKRGMKVGAVRDLLYNKSGLLGVSGLSSDVRQLEASRETRAVEALDLFAYRVGREAGSLIAALGGLDVLVFTAGIGENSAGMRRRISDGLGWAGVVLDAEANARHGPRISTGNSPVGVYVMQTDEELVIARAAERLMAGAMR